MGRKYAAKLMKFRFIHPINRDDLHKASLVLDDDNIGVLPYATDVVNTLKDKIPESASTIGSEKELQ